jgi:hypothetical protein
MRIAHVLGSTIPLEQIQVSRIEQAENGLVGMMVSALNTFTLSSVHMPSPICQEIDTATLQLSSRSVGLIAPQAGFTTRPVYLEVTGQNGQREFFPGMTGSGWTDHCLIMSALAQDEGMHPRLVAIFSRISSMSYRSFTAAELRSLAQSAVLSLPSNDPAVLTFMLARADGKQEVVWE